MQNFFVLLFEFIIDPYSNATFYEYLYQSESWALPLALGYFLIPPVVMALYYKVLDPRLPKRVHWVIALSVVFVAVFVFGYYQIYVFFDDFGCIADPVSCGFEEGLTPENNLFGVGFICGLTSLITALIATFFFRFLSINNKRNPF